MGVPGKWAFHVGLVDTDIEQPSGYEGEGECGLIWENTRSL